MEEIGTALIVNAISSVISAIISILVFMPLLLWISWSLPNDEAPGFKIRTLVASQAIFWGSLVFVAIVDPPSVGEFIGNGIPFIFNLVLIYFATGIGMRAAMGIRNILKGKPEIGLSKLDQLQEKLKRGESARDAASKITDIFK